MARISVTEANQSLVTTNWAFLSLHSADPGTTGASEIAGGAYARVAVAWSVAASSTVSNTGALSVNLPASTTAAYFGVWSAITVGVYYIGGAMTPAVTTGTSAGVVTIAVGQLVVNAS